MVSERNDINKKDKMATWSLLKNAFWPLWDVKGKCSRQYAKMKSEVQRNWWNKNLEKKWKTRMGVLNAKCSEANCRFPPKCRVRGQRRTTMLVSKCGREKRCHLKIRSSFSISKLGGESNNEGWKIILNMKK